MDGKEEESAVVVEPAFQNYGVPMGVGPKEISKGLELEFILHLVQTVHHFVIKPPCHSSSFALAGKPLSQGIRIQRAQIELLGRMELRVQYSFLRPYECAARRHVEFSCDLVDRQQVLCVQPIGEALEAIFAADVCDRGATEWLPSGTSTPFGV